MNDVNTRTTTSPVETQPKQRAKAAIIRLPEPSKQVPTAAEQRAQQRLVKELIRQLNIERHECERLQDAAQAAQAITRLEKLTEQAQSLPDRVLGRFDAAMKELAFLAQVLAQEGNTETQTGTQKAAESHRRGAQDILERAIRRMEDLEA